jgi:uncharacterized protein (PEP-CTERM system associated)
MPRHAPPITLRRTTLCESLSWAGTGAAALAVALCWAVPALAQESDAPSGGAAAGSSAGAPSTGASSTGAVPSPAPALGMGSGLTPPGIGYGSSILPSTGFGGSLGNIRDFVNTPLTRGGTRMFTFDNSVQVQAGYIDNVQGVASSQKPQGSLELRVTPNFNVAAEGRRTQVSLNYSPTLYYYPQVDSESRIDQSLNGRSHTELVSQTAFLDLSAFAGQTSNNNINGQNSSTVASRQDRTQIYNFSANPYLVHDFGTTGSGRLDYSIADTITQGTNNGNNNGNNSPFNAFGSSGNSRTITQTEGASFSTGEDFGRFNHTVALRGTQYSGTGSLNDGHRNTATYDIAYAYSRFITFTGEVGYEDLFYSGVTTNGVVTSLPYHLEAPLGSVGIRVTPNADSSVSLSYGYVDGGTSFTLDGTYKPTARTVIYANSSSGVTTNAQQIQNYASGTQVTQNGTVIDPRTGAPVQYSNNNLSNSAQVYRLTSTSLTGALLLTRDTFTVTLAHTDQSSVGGGQQQSSGSSTSGSLGWQHDLSESVSTSANVQYGVYKTNNSGGNNQSNPTLSGSATLTKVFTERLSGTANYNYYTYNNGNSGNTGTSRVTVNEILFGLLQRF